MTDALGREIGFAGQPIDMDRTPSRIRVAPPEIGEHTDEILAEFGYTEGEIATFRREGIV